MIIKEIQDFDLRKIANSGQCFRMNLLGSGAYSVIALGKYLEILDNGDGRFQFSCSEADFLSIWTNYFDLSCDYTKIRSLVPSGDTFLSEAIEYGWGIHLLRQDPWEVTASFILSQRKSIPAIKTAVESLCSKYGTVIVPDSDSGSGGGPIYSFPCASALADLSCCDIGSCSLGYRDKYIINAAQCVANRDIDFSILQNTDPESAKSALKSLYGVGDKVASCILLFGLGHLNAFPEDVWIKRVIETQYAGIFPKSRYDGYLGIIQQYMFYYGKSNAYKKRNAAF